MELIFENGAKCPERLLSRSDIVSALYEQYGTDVLRLCFTYLHNRPDAEDAAQETFLKIWRKLDYYEGRNYCTVRSWIMRIACNTCKDLLRRSWRKHEDRRMTPEDLPMHEDTAGEDVELFMDIMNLPEKYRSVILMVYWQRMTVGETADIVRTSKSTVCRRLKKAESMLAIR